MESAIWRELGLLKARPVPVAEINQVVNGLEADFIRRLASHMGLARQLGNAEALTGDWRNFDSRARWRAVTPARIMQAARRWFTQKNSAVATLVNPHAPIPRPARRRTVRR